MGPGDPMRLGDAVGCDGPMSGGDNMGCGHPMGGGDSMGCGDPQDRGDPRGTLDGDRCGCTPWQPRPLRGCACDGGGHEKRLVANLRVQKRAENHSEEEGGGQDEQER